MADPLIYWVDRCLGKDTVPAALRAAGVSVTTYEDLYPGDTTIEDQIWIPEVTARGWVILTKDKNIRRAPVEIEALRNANARYVCLTAGNMRGDAGRRWLHEVMRLAIESCCSWVGTTKRATERAAPAGPAPLRELDSRTERRGRRDKNAL